MRIGFACKYLHHDRSLKASELKLIEQAYNGKATTARWLNEQAPDVPEQRLREIVQFNLQAVRNLMLLVSDMPPHQKMLRIGSDVLPMFTHAVWKSFYQCPVYQQQLAGQFAELGKFARDNDIRISFIRGSSVC